MTVHSADRPKEDIVDSPRRILIIAGACLIPFACGPSDAEIERQVRDAFARGNWSWVEVAVAGGQVTLSGSAPNEYALADARRIVSQLPDVRDVVDELALDTALVRRKTEAATCQDEIARATEGRRISFTSGATLDRASRTLLNQIATILGSHTDIEVEVRGHTDSSGSEAANQRVSEQRAQAVVRYLEGRGVAAGRLIASGYGESRPIADNATAAGRAANRRVELIVRMP